LFDEYAKKLKELEQDVPKIFKKVAKKGAIKFVNEAQDRTDREGLVDTGAYKRNWQAKPIEPMPDVYGVECQNNMEYASFLEYGHRTRGNTKVKGRFVGELSIRETEYYCVQELEKALEKAYKQK
jgi:hypothetical protein